MEQILDVRDVAPAIRVLCLNRPDVRNALSVELRDCVSAAIDEASADRGVSAVVLTAAGSTFSAGFDLKEFERAAADASFNTVLWASSDRFHHAVLRCSVPVICALNGPALAGGFDLATLCERVQKLESEVADMRRQLRRLKADVANADIDAA